MPTRVIRLLGLGLLGVAAVGVALAGAAVIYRMHRQGGNEQAMQIASPPGIDEELFIPVGGTEQWISIRGQDRANPVLLILHGGPGSSWGQFGALFLEWEKAFTLVRWDQRGSGRSFAKSGAPAMSTMSIPQMVTDGIEVAEYVSSHLGHPRIILLGHSWGSILGMHMIARRPDLFSAYVGTAQTPSLPRSEEAAYFEVLRRAQQAANQQAVSELEHVGPGPYRDFESLASERKWAHAFGPVSDRVFDGLGAALELTFFAPRFTLRDLDYKNKGFDFSIRNFWPSREPGSDLAGLGDEFQVPIFIFQGEDDLITPLATAREYFNRLHAPHKELVVLEGGGHLAVFSMRARFLDELKARVRPVVTATKGTKVD